MTATSGGPRTALVALGYGTLGLALSWPLPRYLATAIPGDGFDGWQNYWNLWWVERALLRDGGSIWWTDLLDHPRGVSLIFHTLNLPNALLSLPLQRLSGVISAYNLVVFLSFALGGLGVYLLALRTLGRGDGRARAAALVSGAIFAYCPFHFAHLLGHMQVFAFQWLPFYALVLLGLLGRLRAGRKPGGAALVAVAFVVLAALTDWYNLIYLGLLTGLWSTWCAWSARRRGLRLWAQMVLVPGGVGLIALALLAPLLLPMAAEAARADYMVPDESHITNLSADLLALVLPQEMHPLWGEATGRLAAQFPSSTSERMVSLGLVPLLLAAVGWWRGSERGRLFVWVGLVFLVLSLGPVLHVGGEVVRVGGRPVPLPWLALYRAIPFLGIARSVGRYSVMAALAVSVLAGVGLHQLSRQLGGRWLLLPLAAGALTLVEFAPIPYPVSFPDTPGWYAALRNEPLSGAVLNLPVNWDRPQYLLYQTQHWLPLVSGYTSRRNPWSPVESYPGLQQLRCLAEDVLPFPDPATFATIAADLGLRYVAIDRYQMPGGEERRLTEELASRLLQGQPIVYSDERLTVYMLQGAADQRPYANLVGPWGPPQMGAAGGRVRRGCSTCDVVAVTYDQPAEFTVSCLGEPERRIRVDAGRRQSLLGVGLDRPRGESACEYLAGVRWSVDEAE
ncbi:MAG: hypothetical protein HPY83_04015 [Anaerolineae bacterium]|nr:hypothetical protein [Anaerolineae bacterium]